MDIQWIWNDNVEGQLDQQWTSHGYPMDIQLSYP